MLFIPRRACAAATFFALSFLLPFAAHAVQRTFVSISGSDANTASNCSATAPCRGFAAALTVTDSGGEIIVGNSGGYGPVTINKSVSIIAPDGVYAGISVPTGSGITIATAGVKVVLRGLTINGLGGTYGAYMSDGAELTVENCQISNLYPGNGLYVNTPAKVHMSGSAIRGSGYGAYLQGGVNASIEDTEFVGNSYGVFAYAAGSVTTRVSIHRSTSNLGIWGYYAGAISSGATVMSISASVAANNTQTGFYAYANDNGLVHLNVKDSVASGNSSGGRASVSAFGTTFARFSNNLITGNSSYGLYSANSGTILTASGNTVTNNDTGLAQVTSSTFRSTGDNTVADNTTNVSGVMTPLSKQ